jgi:signal transduction histidine kinase
LEQVKGELRLALEEVAQLTNTGQPSSPIHLIAPANFEKHVQQLRQPVKSLRENIQLLLTESSQHSSSPQRKYADRLQASIDRLTMLLDDFLRSIELSSAPHDPQLGPVVLDDLVHEVIDRLSPVMKTRDIAFRLDLQGQLPVAMLDREALTRVLEILLANAGVASPSKSQVTLALSIQTKDNEPDYLLIQVTGFGRETTEGMPLLFSRILPPKRFSEDPARNLAALKTIVEAQQGRIWADPASDQDLTISVLLPVEVLATPLEAEESAGA